MKIKIILLLLPGFLMASCRQPTDSKHAGSEPADATAVRCPGDLAAYLETVLDTVWKESGQHGRYRLWCAGPNYYQEGDFDGDDHTDMAVLVESTRATDEQPMVGLLICRKNPPRRKPTLLGAGQTAFGMDDYSWIGIFETVAKGDTIHSNWNDTTEDFYQEGEIIPPDKTVILASDALFVHQDEACGGGYIYWKNGNYHWLQFE